MRSDASRSMRQPTVSSGSGAPGSTKALKTLTWQMHFATTVDQHSAESRSKRSMVSTVAKTDAEDGDDPRRLQEDPPSKDDLPLANPDGESTVNKCSRGGQIT